MKEKTNNSIEKQSGKLYLFRVYLTLAIIHSIFSIFLIITSPSSSDQALLGLSKERLILMLIILISLGILLWILFKSWFNPKKIQTHLHQVISKLATQPIWGIVLIILWIISLVGIYLITFSIGVEDQFVKTFLLRLLPIIIWVTGLVSLTLITLIWDKYGFRIFNRLPKGNLFYFTLLIIGISFLAWNWVSTEIVPIERPQSGFNTLSTPVISPQVFLAWISSIGILFITAILRNKNGESEQKQRRVDLIIFLGIWFVTILLWQSKPITPNWFISEPSPPNFEFYPTSDARVYDLTSQLALVGEGFQFFSRRPVHTVFLTILHLLAGQDYEKIAFLQVVVLALLPSFIYLLTKSLFNRGAGSIAAILIMFREANSISIGGNITVSHAKQFMVDVPMALVVVILSYLLVLWFKNIENGNLLALMAGGFLGLIMLIRLESFVFIFPVIVILAILLFPSKRYSLWLKQLLPFSIGIILLISPWIYRNWEKTGLIYIDSPVFYQQVLSLRYKPIPAETKPIQTPVKSDDSIEINKNSSAFLKEQESTPTPPPVSPKPTKPSVLDEPENRLKTSATRALMYVKTNYQQISGFILTHFLNSQIQTLLILPTSFQGVESLTTFIAHNSTGKLLEECCSTLFYVQNKPYWKEWDGIFPINTLLPLAIIVLMIALGINESWKKLKTISLTPLFLWSVYIIFNAVFRNSGGRYILPVDWTGILYFSIGLAYTSNTFLINTFSGLKNHNQQYDKGIQNEIPHQKLSIYKTLFLGLLIFLIGCLIPLLEASFSRIYSPITQDRMVVDLLESDILTQEERKDIETFISQGGTIITGRGLYPRYFTANEGELGRKKGAFAPKPYHRLVFHVVGPESHNFALPLDKKPTFFPNGSDVLALTCPDLEPLSVTIFETDGSPKAIYFRSPSPSKLTCPVSEIQK